MRLPFHVDENGSCHANLFVASVEQLWLVVHFNLFLSVLFEEFFANEALPALCAEYAVNGVHSLKGSPGNRHLVIFLVRNAYVVGFLK